MKSLNLIVKDLDFIEKLKVVIELGILDYWEDRQRIPNLSVDEFVLVLNKIDSIVDLKWVKRKSNKGPRGRTGETLCFKFNCQIKFFHYLKLIEKKYFVKGYYFEKNDLKGVTIQSFRQVGKNEKDG